MKEMVKLQKYGKEVCIYIYIHVYIYIYIYIYIFGNGSSCTLPVLREMGQHAIKFLHHLSELSVDEYGCKNSMEFKSLWC